jgi:hypothetical protein
LPISSELSHNSKTTVSSVLTLCSRKCNWNDNHFKITLLPYNFFPRA